MDKCKYKNLLRDSAKLISNSQYTNQNTAYLPLDVYTCYDNFLPPDFSMSGASKMSPWYYYSPLGYHYSLINMKPTGPTGSTTNSVWNNSLSATTLEYYLPYLRMSAYTGKFRSSVYKWDNNQGGFVYPPVHTRIFNSFPQTCNNTTISQTTATTFSVFFQISGVTNTTTGDSTVTAPKFYWWGKNCERTNSNVVAPRLKQWDNLSTGGTLTSYLSNVTIGTGGTISSYAQTGATLTSSAFNGISATKNGHIIPIPNITTGAINVNNAGVTGNGGYWENGKCYMTGLTWDFTIGAGNAGTSGGLILSGMPTLVSSSGGPHHGLYTGFATGNVYVYTANCEYKLVDVIPVSQTSSSAGMGSAANSNTYLTKGSFIYSGNGTTGGCYLSSGVTHDTLIDNPNSDNYAGINNRIYQHNLYYSPSDHTFIAVSNPPQPKLVQQNTTKLINSEELGENTNTTQEIELVVESLPVTSSGDSKYYLTQDPIGDVTLSLNGVVLQKDIEYTHDKREIDIVVDRTVAGSVNIDLSDNLVVSYIKGSGVVGLVSEAATVPASITEGGIIRDVNYSTFNHNTVKGNYEYYTDQPMDRSKESDLANLVVLLNGERLTPNKDYYRSNTLDRLIIFNTGITLTTGDVVSIYYLTNLLGQESQSLGSSTKEIVWTVSPAPLTDNGYFEVQVTWSGDTNFISASTYNTTGYRPDVATYQTTIGPFTEANKRYLYRVVNHRTFISASASTISTSATSLTNKFDTLNAAFKSY